MILFLLYHPILLFTADISSAPNSNLGSYDVAINCGSVQNSTARDGREWIGELAMSTLQQEAESSISSTRASKSALVDPVPYMTARISSSQFQYRFQVKPGEYFIRLHFCPDSYKGFERSTDLFSVKAGPFTLLDHFSASQAAASCGGKVLVKEYYMSVQENQALHITFSPDRKTSSKSTNTYAFINGIELISMPNSLFYTQAGELGVPVVGQNYRYHIDLSTALELVHIMNTGGMSMFHGCSKDADYLLENRADLVNYDPQSDKSEFSWKIPLDVGFQYLVRFRFYDLGTEFGEIEFNILINNHVVDDNIGILKLTGGNGIPFYQDYMVVMKGNREEHKRDIVVALMSRNDLKETLINGLEVYKLSNHENNLASPNHMFSSQTQMSWTKKLLGVMFALGSGNSTMTTLTILVTLINITVYKLRQYWEDGAENNMPFTLNERHCRRFSLAAIQSATNNFSEGLVIGKGGFGKVYKGFIDKRTKVVAIKRLSSNSRQGAHEFWTEIEMLSKLRHIHLVSLLGYCNESREMILVYEYMPRGTLAYNLHKLSRDSNDINPLTWEQRLKICIDAARGLDYLHTGSEHGVIHRDVKSSNILLDQNFVAKVSDFGLAKLEKISQSHSYVSTKVKGTRGYLDPQYCSTRKLTRKTDVYAFGVVLFEVLSNRRAVDFSLPEDQWNLAIWAQSCIREGEVDQIIAASLKGEISTNSLEEFMKVAEKCLDYQPKQRPTMAQVVTGLELSLAQHQNSTSRDKQGLPDYELVHSVVAVQSAHPTPMQNVVPHPKNGITGDLRNNVVKRASNFHRRDERSSGYRSSWRWPWEAIFKKESVPQKLKLFTFKELQKATKNFSSSNIIDGCGFGNTYKACLADGSLVAVRRFSGTTPSRDFQAEVGMPRMAVHRNILRLHGVCMTSTECLTVHPYMANGSVESCLRKRLPSQPPLSWPIRKQIALGSSRALLYLHEDCDPKIIHCDVRAANMLLDDKFEIVIGNFALAKFMDSDDSHVSTVVCGTSGLIAPECLSTGKTSEKIDVFGYGMMLLELITGQRVSYLASVANDDTVKLLDWVRRVMKDRNIVEIVDSDLQTNYVKDEVEQLIQVSLLCTQHNPANRPNMAEVVRMLGGDGLAERWDAVQEMILRQVQHQFLDDFDNPTMTINDADHSPRKQIKKFSLHELQVATNNFSQENIIGGGESGKVYKGCLADGSLLAVKQVKELKNELYFQMVSKMTCMPRHPNILVLRGVCLAPTEWLLVYPYMANGSVASYLRKHPPSRPSLEWLIRKYIALRAAKGLLYLHDGCNPRIIHCDFNAENILLDDQFEAVVKLTNSAKLIDQEHIVTEECSEKTDVFGYGVMLLELISGKRFHDLVALAGGYEVMLHDWIKGILEEKKVAKLVDFDLQNNYIEAEVEELIELSLLCTLNNIANRPKMAEVVRVLGGHGMAERRDELWNADIVTDRNNHTTENLDAEELSGPR